MKISITWELAVFFMMICQGVIQGVVFDFFRTVRKIFSKGFFKTGITDILYWICAAVIFAIFIREISFGEIRFFMILGLGLGLVFYFLLFTKTIKRIFEGFFWLFLKIFKFFFENTLDTDAIFV